MRDFRITYEDKDGKSHRAFAKTASNLGVRVSKDGTAYSSDPSLGSELELAELRGQVAELEGASGEGTRG